MRAFVDYFLPFLRRCLLRLFQILRRLIISRLPILLSIRYAHDAACLLWCHYAITLFLFLICRRHNARYWCRYVYDAAPCYDAAARRDADACCHHHIFHCCLMLDAYAFFRYFDTPIICRWDAMLAWWCLLLSPWAAMPYYIFAAAMMLIIIARSFRRCLCYAAALPLLTLRHDATIDAYAFLLPTAIFLLRRCRFSPPTPLTWYFRFLMLPSLSRHDAAFADAFFAALRMPDIFDCLLSRHFAYFAFIRHVPACHFLLAALFSPFCRWLLLLDELNTYDGYITLLLPLSLLRRYFHAAMMPCATFIFTRMMPMPPLLLSHAEPPDYSDAMLMLLTLWYLHLSMIIAWSLADSAITAATAFSDFSGLFFHARFSRADTTPPLIRDWLRRREPATISSSLAMMSRFFWATPLIYACRLIFALYYATRWLDAIRCHLPLMIFTLFSMPLISTPLLLATPFSFAAFFHWLLSLRVQRRSSSAFRLICWWLICHATWFTCAITCHWLLLPLRHYSAYWCRYLRAIAADADAAILPVAAILPRCYYYAMPLSRRFRCISTLRQFSMPADDVIRLLALLIYLRLFSLASLILPLFCRLIIIWCCFITPLRIDYALFELIRWLPTFFAFRLRLIFERFFAPAADADMLPLMPLMIRCFIFAIDAYIIFAACRQFPPDTIFSPALLMPPWATWLMMMMTPMPCYADARCRAITPLMPAPPASWCCRFWWCRWYAYLMILMPALALRYVWRRLFFTFYRLTTPWW